MIARMEQLRPVGDSASRIQVAKETIDIVFATARISVDALAIDIASHG
jgi:hypothetical protein